MADTKKLSRELIAKAFREGKIEGEYAEMQARLQTIEDLKVYNPEGRTFSIHNIVTNKLLGYYGDVIRAHAALEEFKRGLGIFEDNLILVEHEKQ